MDLIARAVEKKIINEEVYRDLAVKTTRNLLESYGYECGQAIGIGSFGDVIEIENKRKSSKVAAKIVLNSCISKSETDVWPKLKSDYILPLLGKVSFMDAPTTVFFSPLCQGSLSNKLEVDDFVQKRKIFKVLKSYLHDIVSGLGYVHGKNLNHLDLKLTNVLIKKDGKACICDFGCVCSADTLVDSYASPLFYRPPEAQITREGQTPVNGIKYDIWTLGVLALEIFTRKMLSETILKSTGGRIFSWDDQIYPVMFQILQDKNFEILIQRSSPKSKLSLKKVIRIRNFIVSCLNPNPEARPSCSDLLNHKLFGGSYVFSHPTSSDDIWDKYSNPTKLKRMVLRYRAIMEHKIQKGPTSVGDFCEGDSNTNAVDKVDAVNEWNEKGDAGTPCEFEKVGRIREKNNKRNNIYKWFQKKFSNFRKLFSGKKISKQSH